MSVWSTAILAQNKALAHLDKGASLRAVIDLLNQIGADAASAKEQYELLRADIRI